MTKKRKDECLFCKKRICNVRVVTDDMRYDEIACYEHQNDLYQHADEVLGGKGSGIYRHHISSSGKLKRGENFNWRC